MASRARPTTTASTKAINQRTNPSDGNGVLGSGSIRLRLISTLPLRVTPLRVTPWVDLPSHPALAHHPSGVTFLPSYLRSAVIAETLAQARAGIHVRAV